MQFKPLGMRVLVKPDAADERTSGGIVLPQRSQEIPIEGVVVAVGTGRKDPTSGNLVKPKDWGVEKGMRVRFASFSGTEVDLDGVLHKVMNVEEILGAWV